MKGISPIDYVKNLHDSRVQTDRNFVNRDSGQPDRRESHETDRPMRPADPERRSSVVDEPAKHNFFNNGNNKGKFERSNSLTNGAEMDTSNSAEYAHPHRRGSEQSTFYNQGNRGRFPSESNFSNSPYHSSPGGQNLMSPITPRAAPKHQIASENRRNPELELGKSNPRQFMKDHLTPAPSTSSPNTPATPIVPPSNHLTMNKIQHRLKNRRRRALTVWDGQLVLSEKFQVTAQMLHYGPSTINRVPHRNMKFASRVPNSVASDIFKSLNKELKKFCTPTFIKGDTFLQGSWIVLPAKIDGKIRITPFLGNTIKYIYLTLQLVRVIRTTFFKSEIVEICIECCKLEFFRIKMRKLLRHKQRNMQLLDAKFCSLQHPTHII